MTQTSETIKDFARRVLHSQANGKRLLPETLSEAAETSFDGLRQCLIKVIGSEGFRAMLARALVLARREFPWLEGMQISTTGELIDLRESSLGREPAEVEAGFVSVLVQFLSLLVGLVGEGLTGRLLYEIWPTIPFHKPNFDPQEVDG